MGDWVMQKILVTDEMTATFEEKCLPNIRWAGPGELEQLWAIIEYRQGRPFDRREEWREVPNAP